MSIMNVTNQNQSLVKSELRHYFIRLMIYRLNEQEVFEPSLCRLSIIVVSKRLVCPVTVNAGDFIRF